MKKKQINEIDLHGIRHQKALDLVSQTLYKKQLQGSFTLTIITGNSSYLQKIILFHLYHQYKYVLVNYILLYCYLDFLKFS